jgi:hypothetical protein
MAARQSFLRSSVPENKCSLLFGSRKEFTVVSFDEKGYEAMQLTIFAHAFTGQSKASSDLNWVITSFLESLFGNSTVIEMHSAKCRSGSL